MKKLIVSAGLVTLGAAGLQAAYAPGLSPMETSKPWSVSASLRGFYDDNYNNAPSHPSTPGLPKAESSGGFEINPTFSFNLPMDQTYIGVKYDYSMKYYFDRPDSKVDQTHALTLKADHKISERYKVSFNDSFVYSQEPAIIDSSGAVTAPTLRSNAEAIRNHAILGFSSQVTELIGVDAFYDNTYYHYLHEPYDVLLNRVEHLFDVEGTWQVQQHLTGLLGYQYGIVDYLSHDPVSSTPGAIAADDRDSTSHYFYVGVKHGFSSQLDGTIKVGAQYTKFSELSGQDGWSPYVNLTGTYTYLPGSYVQFGFTQARNATDQIGGGTPGTVTTDQESSTFFASVNHRVTPRVTASLFGQYQHSVYQGGTLDGEVDNYFTLGLNLSYRINNNWSTDIGYDFTHLTSDTQDRGFSRNIVHAGVTANF